MSELHSWELFSSVVSGMRASICGSDSIVYLWTPPHSSHAALSSDDASPVTRLVKLAPKARSGMSSGWFDFGCFMSSFRGGASAASTSSASQVSVSSFLQSPSDPKPTEVRPETLIRLPPGRPGAEHIAAVLAALWDHSRALWVPLDAQSVIMSQGPERTLPLSTPVSRCFRVVVGLAARIARPVHTVSNAIRSPAGGSAILKSPAYGAGSTIVVNVEFQTEVVNVVGKREDRRAVKASRSTSRNLDVARNDMGWRQRPSDPDPVAPGTLEMALFSAVQALIEVIERRE